MDLNLVNVKRVDRRKMDDLVLYRDGTIGEGLDKVGVACTNTNKFISGTKPIYMQAYIRYI